MPAAEAQGSPFAFAEVVSVPGGTTVDQAVALSQLTFPAGATEAVLGRDDVFADSLASGGLQQTTRPLLLTASASLSLARADELRRLAVQAVLILGGDEAISPQVEADLQAMGIQAKRYFGATRIETALEIARIDLPDAPAALLVRADGPDRTTEFADSLAAGGASAGSRLPVLFTPSAELADATARYLAAAPLMDVFVVGGPAAVSEDVVAAVEALGKRVTRIAGGNRAATAVSVAAARGVPELAATQRVLLVDGSSEQAWAAGFAAAAQSAITSAPILLSAADSVPPETSIFLGDDRSGVTLVCGPSATAAACDTASARPRAAPTSSRGSPSTSSSTATPARSTVTPPSRSDRSRSCSPTAAWSPGT